MKSGAGLISLLSIFVFTRLMSPDEYGIYAMLLSGLGIGYAVCFQWLSQGLGRFLESETTQQGELISTVIFCFFAITIFGSILWLIAFFAIEDVPWRKWILFLPPLITSYSWYELNLRMANARMRYEVYGYLSLAKTSLGLSLGVLLYMQYGLSGVFYGAILGAIITPLFWMRSSWQGFDIKLIDKKTFLRILSYGLPLALTVTLTVVVDVSDRFLIAMLLDAKQAGLYSASYDLVVQTMGFVVAAFYLASFPVLIQSIETKGLEKIGSDLGQYSTLLFATSVPMLVIFVALPDSISLVIFGLPFRDTATGLIPVMACGVFVGGFKIHLLDLIFQLQKKTLWQIWPAVVTAVVNVALNVLWIPIYGVVGAAYATLAAFLVGGFISGMMVLKVVSLAFPRNDFLKIILAGGCMYLLLISIQSFTGFAALIFQVLAGLSLYLMLILLLNVAEARYALLKRLLIINEK